MKRANVLLLVVLALVLATLLPPVHRARATPSGIIQQSVAACDPWYPTECLAPGGSSFTNITTATDTVIKASSGSLAGISVNTGGASSVATVYNNTTCTGAKIGTFSTAAAVFLPLNVRFTVGLCVTTATGTPADITVTWR